MLQISIDLEDPKAYVIVNKFINDRLKGLMEDIILDEVVWKMAMGKKLDESANSKSFDELVNIADLMTDMDFAENVSLGYLPEGFPIKRANQEFFGLYNLLKAKKEYVPEITMEYILFRIIHSNIGEVDMINEDMEDGLFDDMMDDPFFEGIEDEEITTIQHIPEPDRETVMNAIRKHCEEQYEPEELEDAINFCINQYEDLREYEEICFQDSDFLLLDEMDENELVNSTLNKYMGIADPKKPKVITFPLQGKDGQDVIINAEINVHPWDMEDED